MVNFTLEEAQKVYDQQVKMVGYSKYGYPLVRIRFQYLTIEDEGTVIYSATEVKELVKKGELVLL